MSLLYTNSKDQDIVSMIAAEVSHAASMGLSEAWKVHLAGQTPASAPPIKHHL